MTDGAEPAKPAQTLADPPYLIIALGGGGGVSTFRVFNVEVAQQIVDRLNQIQGYSARMFADAPPESPVALRAQPYGRLGPAEQVPHYGVGRGGQKPDGEIPF